MPLQPWPPAEHDENAVCEWQEKRGIHLWLDNNELHGNMKDHFTDGIDASAVFIPFITKEYIDKAAGRGPNGNNDNVKIEFQYASQREKPMLPVLLDSDCRNQRDWHGVVGLHAGTLMYVDFTAETFTSQQIDELCERIEGEQSNQPPITVRSNSNRSGRGGLDQNERHASLEA